MTPFSQTTASISEPTPTAASRLVTVHGVNWHNVLDFTHLFRGFRVAINPAKLAMALLAIVLIYAAGRTFDAFWGPQVYQNEISEYAVNRPETFRGQRAGALENRADNLQTMLEEAGLHDQSLTPERIRNLKDSPAAAVRALKSAYRARFFEEVGEAHQRRVSADALAAEREKDPGLRIRMNSKTPAETEQDERARAAARLLDRMHTAQETAGGRIFDSFLIYEIDQFDRLVENTLTFVRVSSVRSSSPGGIGDSIEGSAVFGGLISKNPDRMWRSDTVAGCIANMAITAPRWLFCGTAPMQWRSADADTLGGWVKTIGYRAFYLATLGLLAFFSLLVLAFTGASITRLSALELAGVERVPLKDVFEFAYRRLWVFVKAPTAPFVIFLIIGLAMAAGGLLGAIPFVGPVVLGVLFFIFLAVGFILMLLLLGIIGGFNLLYPTVAVEGADSFDAMSRSFAYVYARPWRVLFYTVTSLIYGVITFLFISFAAYLILMLTHTFVGWGTNFLGCRYGAYSGTTMLDTLWPMPRFGQLISPINWYAMSWGEYSGALFLHFWVFLLITSIGAYVISYYFSSHTIMYLLLRRSVDGQSMREVFQEPAGIHSPSPAAAESAAAPEVNAPPAAPTA